MIFSLWIRGLREVTWLSENLVQYTIEMGLEHKFLNYLHTSILFAER